MDGLSAYETVAAALEEHRRTYAAYHISGVPSIPTTATAPTLAKPGMVPLAVKDNGPQRVPRGGRAQPTWVATVDY